MDHIDKHHTPKYLLPRKTDIATLKNPMLPIAARKDAVIPDPTETYFNYLLIYSDSQNVFESCGTSESDPKITNKKKHLNK